jgi:hypothetical protein
MSKRLEQMRSNPARGWKIADIDFRANRSGGSHYKVSHFSRREILTVPFKRPIKPVYIRKLVEFVDAVRSGS